MAHEKLIAEFVEKMQAAAGANLVSVILYGSAAEGEFHPEYSDLNLLCVLRDVSLPALNKICRSHRVVARQAAPSAAGAHFSGTNHVR